MIVFPNLTVNSQAASSIIQPYGSNGTVVGQLNNTAITSLGLICTVSAGASLTYSIQVTGDPVPTANGNWVDHDVITGLTASKVSNIAWPVSGLRLNVTAYSSGSVTLGVVQWP